MSNDDLHQKLNRGSEITLSVKGRKSGKDIPRPVWFAYEGSMLNLLPVQGSIQTVTKTCYLIQC